MSGEPPFEAPPEPPLHPEAAFALEVTREQWRPLTLVLMIAALGLGAVFLNFRLGTILLAASTGAALVIRLFRSEQDAGLLAVRAKYIDCSVLALLTVGLVVLGLWVPLI